MTSAPLKAAITMLFHLSNIPYWIFLGIGIFLFVFVIISGGGDDDLDLEGDANFEAGDNLLDLDADSDGDFSPLQILGWLGFGKAPLILLLATDFSLWGVLGWMLNVLLNSPTGILSQAIFWGSLAMSLYLGRLIARPLGKIFASFGEEGNSDRLIGCIGTVSSAFVPLETEGKIGQVDVIDSAHRLVTINAQLPHWAKIIPYRGQQVLTIEYQSPNYLVIAKDSSDQQKWLSK
ncbi:DUF1449 family protein [Oscillatoria amoena NRMC-F 0135]|nr:YqiJ family protein [Desertifilum sp.]MDI9638333.1 DUF1449 family protein [Geitlerinema splendidum]MDL5045613.1 DUF1449 family protein [Oscillatoria amoena NRMC-F 0135]